MPLYPHRFYLIVLFVIFCAGNAVAQRAGDGMYAKRYNSSTALHRYPFRNAVQVQLVSFESWKEIPAEAVDGGFYLMKMGRDSLPRMNDTVCYSALREVKSLTYVQADSLADVLYNYNCVYYDQGPGSRIGYFMQCYNPHNAILFINEKGQVFDYIEICFECRNYRTLSQSEQIKLGEMCIRRWEMVKLIFKKAGIQWGVEKAVEHH